MGANEPLGLVYIQLAECGTRGGISQTQISDARTRALAALSQNCGAEARGKDDGVEGLWAVDVVDALDDLRVSLITGMFQRHEHIPVPRPPLRSRPPVLDEARLGFVKYLMDQGKLSES